MNDEEFTPETGSSRTARKEKWVAQRTEPPSATDRRANESWDADSQPNAGPSAASFDFLALAQAVLKQWYWMVLGALLLGGAGAYFGMRLWKPSFTATAELMRFEAPNNTELYKPRQLNERTFADLLQAPDLLESVAMKSRNQALTRQLLHSLMVAPARESERVALSVTAPTPLQAVEVVNLYAAEAARYTRQIQSKEASEATKALQDQINQMDSDIDGINKQIQAHNRDVVKPSQRNTELTKKLQDEQDVLLGLLMKYTERHPSVSAQRAKIEELEKQIQQAQKQNVSRNQPSTVAKSPGLLDSDSGSELLTSQLQALANSRVLLASREREARTFVQNPPGYCRVFTQASASEVTETKRAPKVILLGVCGGALGGGGALLLILLLILLDPKLKTPADARRVTGLPIVGSLGNLNKMTPAAQAQWAFRTWVSLQGKLRSSKNRGFVCGITSSSAGEGRSTWVNLLSQAASDCGYRVLTIAASREDEPAQVHSNGAQHGLDMLPDGVSKALTTCLLNTPAQVTEQLTGENPQPMVHIPLPGWVWNLERRKQWQTALSQWKNIENVVIFVELPPATEPEAVLLAEKLPNLLWLADCGKAEAAETREQLGTLRDAHCNLVGTLLNHDMSTPSRKPFAKWMPCLLLGLCLGSTQVAHAQGGNSLTNSAVASTPTFQTNTSFSAALSPTQRADWQKRLTLGPGDMLNFTLFGQPELARTEVMIGPDGRVSYLQAQGILATGLTIDELRKKFDEELSQYYRAPNVIITPFAYNSKKYYVLGKVVNKGVFTLDRPITIMEAIARAHGFETGTVDNQNSVDLVDLQKSFVMRQGKRLPVNLERLFQEGDLSQNAPLEPNDYIYFASGALKEVYVLGDVNVPGPLTWTENVTVISAISARGGYTLRAYKSKVLVIRGSLNKPQTFVLDTWATLDGRAMDFKLEPKDIIFVPHRPFIRAEELLDLAATAFIQSSVAAWAGQNVGPIFTKPVLPNL
jgi:protein involved in polysaccharide export with SLBB domain/capsular polysaccharide biosynthesis protein